MLVQQRLTRQVPQTSPPPWIKPSKARPPPRSTGIFQPQDPPGLCVRRRRRAQAPFCGTPSPSFCQVQRFQVVLLHHYPNRSTGLPRRRVAFVAWTGPRIRYQRSGSPGRGRETRVRSHTFLAIHGALIHPHHHQPHPYQSGGWVCPPSSRTRPWPAHHHVAPVRPCSVSVDDGALLVRLFPPLPSLRPPPSVYNTIDRSPKRAALLLLVASLLGFLPVSLYPEYPEYPESNRILSSWGSVEKSQQRKGEKKKET